MENVSFFDLEKLCEYHHITDFEIFLLELRSLGIFIDEDSARAIFADIRNYIRSTYSRRPLRSVGSCKLILA